MEFRKMHNKMTLIKESTVFNVNERLDKIRDLLTEKMSRDEVYEKYYSNIEKDDFIKISEADPTRKNDGSPGKYTKWLLKLYMSKKLKIEDLYKATEYLTIMSKYGSKLKVNDVNKLKSLPELYKNVEPVLSAKENGNDDFMSNSEKEKEGKKGAEKAFEDGSWLVIIPRTEEASCYYGKGTQWCTAARENNQFEHYNKHGELLILINKHTGEKYQFHKNTKSFMDSSDDPVELPLSYSFNFSKEMNRFLASKGIDVNYDGLLGSYQLTEYSNKAFIENNEKSDFEIPFIPDDYDDYFFEDEHGESEDVDVFVMRKKGESQHILVYNRYHNTGYSFIYNAKIHSIDAYKRGWFLFNNDTFYESAARLSVTDFEDYDMLDYNEFGAEIMVLQNDMIILLLDSSDMHEVRYPKGTDYMTWDEIHFDTENNIFKLISSEHIATHDPENDEEDVWTINEVEEPSEVEGLDEALKIVKDLLKK